MGVDITEGVAKIRTEDGERAHRRRTLLAQADEYAYRAKEWLTTHEGSNLEDLPTADLAVEAAQAGAWATLAAYWRLRASDPE